MPEIDRLYYILGLNTKEFDAAVANVQRRFAQMANTIASIAGTIGISFGFSKIIQEINDFTDKFEKNMLEVRTIAGYTEEEFKKVKEQILDLATVSPVGIEDLTRALYQTISAGVETTKAIDFLQLAIKGAVAGVTDLYTTVDGLTSVMNAWGLSMDKMETALDQIFYAVKLGKTTFGEIAASIGNVASIASQANVPLSEILAALVVLTKRGLSTSEAITGIRAALKNMINPTNQAIEKANSLGIALGGIEVKSSGFIGKIAEIARKTKGDIDAISQMFEDLEAQTAIAGLIGDLDGLKTTLSQIDGSIDDLKSKFQEEWKAELFDDVKVDAEEVNKYLKDIDLNSKTGQQELQNLITKLKILATSADVKPDEVATILGKINENAEKSGTSIGTILTVLNDVASKTGEPVETIINTILGIDTGIEPLRMQRIMDALDEAAKKAGTTADDIKKAFDIDIEGITPEEVARVFSELAKQLKDSTDMKAALDNASKLSNFASAIVKTADEMGMSVADIIKNLEEVAKGAKGSAGSTQDAYDELEKAIKNKLQELNNSIDRFKKNWGKKTGELRKKIIDSATAIVNWLGELDRFDTKLFYIGMALSASGPIIKGIVAAGKAIKTLVGGFSSFYGILTLIGLAVSGVATVIGIFSKKTDEASDEIKQLDDALNQLNELNFERTVRNIEDAKNSFKAAYERAENFINDVEQLIVLTENYNNALKEGDSNLSIIEEQIKSLVKNNENLQNIVYKTADGYELQVDALTRLVNLEILRVQQARIQSMQAIQEAQKDIEQYTKIKQKYDELKKSFENLELKKMFYRDLQEVVKFLQDHKILSKSMFNYVLESLEKIKEKYPQFANELDEIIQKSIGAHTFKLETVVKNYYSKFEGTYKQTVDKLKNLEARLKEEELPFMLAQATVEANTGMIEDQLKKELDLREQLVLIRARTLREMYKDDAQYRKELQKLINEHNAYVNRSINALKSMGIDWSNEMKQYILDADNVLKDLENLNKKFEEREKQRRQQQLESLAKLKRNDLLRTARDVETYLKAAGESTALEDIVYFLSQAQNSIVNLRRELTYTDAEFKDLSEDIRKDIFGIFHDPEAELSLDSLSKSLDKKINEVIAKTVEELKKYRKELDGILEEQDANVRLKKLYEFQSRLNEFQRTGVMQLVSGDQLISDLANAITSTVTTAISEARKELSSKEGGEDISDVIFDDSLLKKYLKGLKDGLKELQKDFPLFYFVPEPDTSRVKTVQTSFISSTKNFYDSIVKIIKEANEEAASQFREFAKIAFDVEKAPSLRINYMSRLLGIIHELSLTVKDVNLAQKLQFAEDLLQIMIDLTNQQSEYNQALSEAVMELDEGNFDGYIQGLEKALNVLERAKESVMKLYNLSKQAAQYAPELAQSIQGVYKEFSLEDVKKQIQSIKQEIEKLKVEAEINKLSKNISNQLARAFSLEDRKAIIESSLKDVQNLIDKVKENVYLKDDAKKTFIAQLESILADLNQKLKVTKNTLEQLSEEEDKQELIDSLREEINNREELIKLLLDEKNSLSNVQNEVRGLIENYRQLKLAGKQTKLIPEEELANIDTTIEKLQILDEILNMKVPVSDSVFQELINSGGIVAEITRKVRDMVKEYVEASMQQLEHDKQRLDIIEEINGKGSEYIQILQQMVNSYEELLVVLRLFGLENSDIYNLVNTQFSKLKELLDSLKQTASEAELRKNIEKDIETQEKLMKYFKGKGDTERYREALQSIISTLKSYEEQIVKTYGTNSELLDYVTSELEKYLSINNQIIEQERQKELLHEKQRKQLQSQADFMNSVTQAFASQLSRFGAIGELIGSVLQEMQYTVEQLEDGSYRLVSPWERMEEISANIASNVVSWALGIIGDLLEGILGAIKEIREVMAMDKWDIENSDLAQLLENFRQFEENQKKLANELMKLPFMKLLDALTLGIFGFADKTEEKINELRDKLKATASEVAHAFGMAVSDLASSLEDALMGAETYEDFVKDFSESLEEMTKRALIRAFLASDVAQSAMKGVSEAFVKAVEDGFISAEELANIKAAQENVKGLLSIIWNTLEQLGYMQEGVEWSQTEAIKKTITEETGNRLAALLSTINLNVAQIKDKVVDGVIKVEVTNIQNIGGIAPLEYLRALGV